MKGDAKRRLGSQGKKMNQPDSTICHFCQKWERSMKAIPSFSHSQGSLFSFLLPFLSSLILSSFFCLLCFFFPFVMLFRSILSCRWAWPPASFLQIESRFFICYCVLVQFLFTRSVVTYDCPFVLFWLRHHASITVVSPPPLWRSRIAGQWRRGKAHHPSWWFPMSRAVLGFTSSRIVSTPMPKCRLGQVALTKFQLNPKKNKNVKRKKNKNSNNCC